MTPVSGYAVIAKELHEAGIDTLFGVAGEANLDLIACLTEQHAARYIASRHEAGAVAMADGFARASGEFGCATVTCGPGLTNTITALITAVRNQSQVLMITGQLPLEATERSQTIDHGALLVPTGVSIMNVSDPDVLLGAVGRALDEIREKRKPVVLNVLIPVLEASYRLPEAVEKTVSPEGNSTSQSLNTAVEDEEACRHFLDALLDAERPIIVAGRGAVQAGAGPALEKLAVRVGAGLATTLLAHGLFAKNPRNLGFAGGLSSPENFAALQKTDVVAVFGAGMNGWTTRGGSAFKEARKILHCDRDPLAFARSTVGTDVTVCGDADAVATKLLALLDSSDQKTAQTAGDFWWKQAKLDTKGEEEGGKSLLDPRSLCRTINQLLPEPITLTLDGGHFMEFPCQHVTVPDERGFLFTLGFGSIGLGLATAIGAAVGRPDRLSVAVVGDGGLMMSLPEIETAARYQIPLLVLVMNDNCYAAEVKHLEDRGWQSSLVQFANPSFAEIAVALGAKGLTVDTLNDLVGLESMLAAPDGPIVIDAKIDPSVKARWMSIMHQARTQ